MNKCHPFDVCITYAWWSPGRQGKALLEPLPEVKGNALVSAEAIRDHSSLASAASLQKLVTRRYPKVFIYPTFEIRGGGNGPDQSAESDVVDR